MRIIMRLSIRLLMCFWKHCRMTSQIHAARQRATRQQTRAQQVGFQMLDAQEHTSHSYRRLSELVYKHRFTLSEAFLLCIVRLSPQQMIASSYCLGTLYAIDDRMRPESCTFCRWYVSQVFCAPIHADCLQILAH